MAFPSLANICLTTSDIRYVILALMCRCKAAVNILSSLQWIINMILVSTLLPGIYKSLVLYVLENKINQENINKLKTLYMNR